jgi:hypothetical protein
LIGNQVVPGDAASHCKILRIRRGMHGA